MMNNETDNMENDALTQAASKLAAGEQPTRDLWPEIEAAITQPQPRRWQFPFAQAAAVVLLVGGSSAVTYVAMQDRGAEVIPQMAASTELKIEPAAFGNHFALGSDYEHARADLTTQLEKELESLPPETRADIENNLASIRTAIAEINELMVEQPNNVMLQRLLMSNYRRELEILSGMSGMTTGVMPRTDI
jgi:hypothetical protein